MVAHHCPGGFLFLEWMRVHELCCRSAVENFKEIFAHNSTSIASVNNFSMSRPYQFLSTVWDIPGHYLIIINDFFFFFFGKVLF